MLLLPLLFFAVHYSQLFDGIQFIHSVVIVNFTLFIHTKWKYLQKTGAESRNWTQIIYWFVLPSVFLRRIDCVVAVFLFKRKRKNLSIACTQRVLSSAFSQHRHIMLSPFFFFSPFLCDSVFAICRESVYTSATATDLFFPANRFSAFPPHTRTHTLHSHTHTIWIIFNIWYLVVVACNYVC